MASARRRGQRVVDQIIKRVVNVFGIEAGARQRGVQVEAQLDFAPLRHTTQRRRNLERRLVELRLLKFAAPAGGLDRAAIQRVRECTLCVADNAIFKSQP